MLGFNTIKNLFEKNQRADIPINLDKISGGGSNNGESNFLLPNIVLHGTTNTFTGVQDYSVNSQDVYDMTTRDSYFSGLVKQIEELIFVKGGFFQAQKRRIPELEVIMKKYDIEGMLRQIFNYEMGEGGGNWILYPMQGKLQVDPFWAEGSHRARIIGNDDTRKVEKVVITSRRNGSYLPLHTIDLTKNNRFIYLGRYEQGGHYMFSSNPAKKAVFWYILKKYLGGANLMAFKNGMNGSVFISPAYDKLAKMADIFTNTAKVSGEDGNLSKIFSQDPLKIFSQNRELTVETLKREATGVFNTNRTIMLDTPVDITRVDRDNKSMETIPLLELCNREIGFAVRTGRGILDAENLKYNNAEQVKDSLMNFVVNPFKRKFEMLINDILLPYYDSEFELRNEKYIFGQETDEEEIKMYEAKTNRIDKQADIIGKLANTGYKLDLENMEIIYSQPQENITTEPQKEIIKNEEKNEEKIKENDKLNQRFDQKKNLIEETFENPKFNKFNKTIETAISKQIKDYAEKLINYENLEKAMDNFDKDFKPINNFGLGVQQLKNQLLMFAKIGVENIIKQIKKTRGESEISSEILEIIDIQSQIIIKGWSSLSKVQIEIAKEFFPQFAKSENGISYKGIDLKTNNEVLNILKNGIENSLSTKQISKEINQQIPEISQKRAKLIAQTETARALEVASFVQAKNEGAVWKKWSTVKDSLVRPPHTDNEKEGWIPINQAFSNGNMTSGVEVGCRCNIEYSFDEERPS